MENLVDTVGKLQAKIKSILNTARTARSLDRDKFFSKDFTILGKTIGHYADCFKSLGIKTNAEFMNIIGKNFRAPTVRDTVLELEDVVEEWGEFLEECEKILGMKGESSRLIEIGEKINLDYQLMDARTHKYDFC